jgi:hypothetical protein
MASGQLLKVIYLFFDFFRNSLFMIYGTTVLAGIIRELWLLTLPLFGII